jgi:hypothetical protein
MIWMAAGICGTVAASDIVAGWTDIPAVEAVFALFALLGVILPAGIKASGLDEAIKSYEVCGAIFKNLEGDFRRLANVWSNKTFTVFEAEAREVVARADEARSASLTPPEWCFQEARKKIQGGDYKPDRFTVPK